MKQGRFSNKRGFTLIEIALALGILAILIVSVAQARGLSDQARVMAAAESIRTLRGAAESYISGGNMTFSGVSVAALKTNNRLPAGFSATGSNRWGGNYNIAANSGDNTKVDIGLTSVPANAGTQLSSQFQNSAGSTNYDSSSNTWTATF